MPARRLHLVRHGEVHNPEGVLYGRLPGYTLSQRGHRMAQLAVEQLSSGETARPVVRLAASPLERAQQSAQPWSDAFGLEIRTEHRIIEPTNRFEGKTFEASGALTHPSSWPLLRNPFRPSWGEPYKAIAQRMRAAMEDAWDELEESGDDGDIVMVSHQSPIWMAHLDIAGRHLWHDPRSRRCQLSSITSFARMDGRFAEVDYVEPAAAVDAIDTGAV
ncbi:histidine phosphatase family protein [Agrococcus sp. ARC_14]|uniref:histidine phosphatase family protein n=1 Tax=Agrococcus sp. ARC_14 TaxID=2919927 RepID=UPI001F055E6F|nr:histidine phosphatase family protein [Agrococcus sp. ARC_14]MCH1882114.1 histidine phosphatase family protein [Agrococcus sp. ARC_14]